MNYNVISYTIYLPITIVLTIWVAKTLSKHGKVFLIDIMKGNKEVALSLNQLLVVGFYLVNIGYAVMTLSINENIISLQEMIEQLSIKLGTITLILGGMHFFNLYILFTLRNRVNNENKKLKIEKV